MSFFNKILTLSDTPQIEDSMERRERLSQEDSESLVQGTLENRDKIIDENSSGANPYAAIYGAVKGAIDENKEYIGQSLNTMGAIGGSSIVSNFLADMKEQEDNAAYKRNLAQKSYDSIQVFEKGGSVQLFGDGKEVVDPKKVSGKEPEIDTLSLDDYDEFLEFDIFGDEYFDGFMDFRSSYNDHAYKQDEIGENFYATIFNFGIDKIASIVDDIYGREYGYGSGEKAKNLMRMTLVNEASYGQKTNQGPIEGRGYTSGYISADDSGHFYHVAENMAKYADKTEEQAMDLNPVTRTFWYAARMAEKLGIDPKDTDRIIERMKKGDPIVSMMMNTAQIFRNIEDPSTGSSKYPEEVKKKIKSVNKVSKEDWKKMDKDDLRGLATHWLSGWNGYGNLKYRDMDPEFSISEAVKAYEGIRDAGLFDVGGGKLNIEAKPTKVNTQPTIPRKGAFTMPFDNTMINQVEPKHYDGVTSYDPVTNSALDNFLDPEYRSAIKTMQSLQDSGKEKKKENKKGQVVSYRKGGKVYKGVVVGYKDGKPIIKKK